MSPFPLSGLADEAADDIVGQVAAQRTLGWPAIELRLLEGRQVCSAAVSDDAFARALDTIGEAGLRVSSFGSAIGNWSRPITGDFATDLADLRVDGGASVMDLLMQLQAEQLGVPVRRPKDQETTSLGAAFLAGLAEGVWPSLDAVAQRWQLDTEFLPSGPDLKVLADVQAANQAPHSDKSWEIMFGKVQFQRR